MGRHHLVGRGANSSAGRRSQDGAGGAGWLPEAARDYIVHTRAGIPIRELARNAGCHASTILRRVRNMEARRDDPLIDEALDRLRSPGSHIPIPANNEDSEDMIHQQCNPADAGAQVGTETLCREARRILRRLCEPGACLAVARDMEKAVVVRESTEGSPTRTAVVDRAVAQAMALKDWISCSAPARVSRYRITSAGRAALKRLLAEDEARRAGFVEAPGRFGDQHRDYGRAPAKGARKGRARYNLAESPVTAMARRKDKDGNPFLGPDLVAAAERLREDFELAQMGPRITQNWERFLTGGERGAYSGTGAGDGPAAARERVTNALRALGPGLGDVALRVCCFLEGLETAERRMGWSARSGKIVLRIALQRLSQYYQTLGGGSMIG